MKTSLRQDVKIKFQFYFTLLLPFCLLAGCGTDNAKIISNEKSSGSPVPVVASPPRKLDQPDLIKVELAIYSYLLQPQFWTNGAYAAIFVQGTDDVADAVNKRFPDHIPPIKPGGRAQLLPNRTLADKDTGLAAMILSVDAHDAVGDVVQADGRWFAGSEVSGFHTFTLQKTNGDWLIESMK
jgi:hypothetical protein